ncbi:endo-1,4-beta-xylanase [Embleya sp. NPDC005575]|uniref:endo-1,4-beta-xylanase n=1 Tax=Embleya sp. NPDC005575 TaxID=3156892 RepID=UPI0033BC087D
MTRPRRLTIVTSLVVAVLAALFATIPRFDSTAAESPGAGNTAPTAAVSTGTAQTATLRTLAAARGMRFGTAVAAGALSNEQDYRDKVRYEFNSITPESAMGWSRTEPQRGVYQWQDADTVIDFAAGAGQDVRGQTSVWYNSVPDWVAHGNFGADELRAILKAHIEAVVSRYKDRVHIWDVVNEVLNDDGTMRSSFWSDRLGTGYIADALRWARAADPTAKLYINDYNAERVNSKSTALFDLATNLRRQGVPLDGIGFQTHVTVNTDVSQLKGLLGKFADAGFDVAITELDVRMTLPPTQAQVDAQTAAYDSIVRSCIAVTRCVSTTVWGFTDAHSWVPSSLPGWGAATMFDTNLAPKAAYTAVNAALADRDFTTTAVAAHSGKCLDVPHSEKTLDIQLQQYTCNGTSAQSFAFRRVSPGIYTIVNTGNGRCVTVAGASTAPGAAVIQSTCGSGPEQRFELRRVTGFGSAASFQLRPTHSYKCVDVAQVSMNNQAPLIQYTCNADPTVAANQVWQLAGIPGHL